MTSRKVETTLALLFFYSAKCRANSTAALWEAVEVEPEAFVEETTVTNVGRLPACLSMCQAMADVRCSKAVLHDPTAKECKLGRLEGIGPNLFPSSTRIRVMVQKEDKPAKIPHILMLAAFDGDSDQERDLSLNSSVSPGAASPLVSSGLAVTGSRPTFWLRGGVLHCGGDDCVHYSVVAHGAVLQMPFTMSSRHKSGMQAMVEGVTPWIVGGYETGYLMNPDWTWSPGPVLPHAWCCGCLAPVNEEKTVFLLAGGKNDESGSDLSTASAFLYDTSNPGVWTRIDDMGGPRRYHVDCARVTLEDGRSVVVTIGGIGDFNEYDNVDVYDYAANSWSLGPPLPEKKRKGAVVVVGGGTRLIHLGGYIDYVDDQGVPTATSYELRSDLSGWDEIDLLGNTPAQSMGMTTFVYNDE